ncbi:MAG: hypothetical protein WC644_00855 [Ignavibacteria bacterium]
MKKHIILFVIIFISTSSIFSQSLKSISKNITSDFQIKEINGLLLNRIGDTLQVDTLKQKDTVINATKTLVKSITQDSYFTLSSGLMRYDDNKNIFYTSLDFNINTVYIFYIDLGVYGLFNKSDGGIAFQAALGVGFDIVRDILFTSTSVGYFYLTQLYLENIVSLRVNYKFSKSFSAGLDNKFIFNWNHDYPRNIYSIGLNISYNMDN